MPGQEKEALLGLEGGDGTGGRRDGMLMGLGGEGAVRSKRLGAFVAGGGGLLELRRGGATRARRRNTRWYVHT